MDRLKLFGFIICSLAIAFGGVNVSALTIPEVEVDALVQFKLNYIAKASQELLLSWDTRNASSVCESWAGIACTNSTISSTLYTSASGYSLHIQSINLASFGLEGSIAPHLGNLTFLSTLNLSHNAFTGSIPPQLTDCSSLRQLDLRLNTLTSPIPPSLTSLPSLDNFNLCGNNFSGPIPSALFTNITASLRVLALCHNAFTGSIPPDLGQQVPNLQVLLLWQNNLTGAIPPSLGNCSQLRWLQLHSNEFTGSIPAELGMLKKLEKLYLHFNHFTGAIPPSLGNCTNLSDLSLGSNKLTGSIPPGLQNVPNLQYLWLGKNNLTGAITPSLGNCSHLHLLQLHSNEFTGSIPAELGMLKKLAALFLYENHLTGAIPPSLANCSHLQYWLDLHSNEFTGSIPAELGMLNKLEKLYLHFNHLTGAIPPSLGNCTNLSSLALSHNELTGSIPTQLGLLGDVVTWIGFHGNKLTGAIPRSLIVNCSSLQLLDLGDNLLSGTILVEFGLLGNLTRLYLNGNNFAGIIPSSLGNCTSMVLLVLESNQLTGTIPASLSMLGQLEGLYLEFNHLSGLLHEKHLDVSNFTKLTVLNLYSNELGGPLLPINFSKLQQIQVLNIGSNRFTGEIPWDSLVNCTYLFALDLSNNSLTGAIPSILGRFRGLEYLYLQGNLLWGAIPEFSEFNNQLNNLLQLNLSSNHLNGSLPSSLARALLTLAGSLDLSHNDFSGSLPPWLGQLDRVLGIYLSHNNFAGTIPASLGDCVALEYLSLSNNHLSGDLPLQFGNLAYLQFLDLSHNNLSGGLPSFLGSRMLALKMLNVSFNNFTGPIPTHEGVFKHLTASSFQGNPGLCGRLLNKTCIGVLRKQHHHHNLLMQLKNWKGILLLTLLSLIGLVLPLVITWHCCFSQHVDAPRTILGHEAKRFTEKEIIEATQGYSEVNLLGQGGIGVVYKGVLSDGQIVAVKKLKDMYNGSEESLLKEMHILCKLRHRNLVQILGCVLNLDTKALVLQYMENGSLEHYLHMHIQSHSDQRSEQRTINNLRYWVMVNRVAMGIAHALAYLHHGYGESIIHGDVKPGNILLDSDLEPHLADFGLAKLIPGGAEAASLTSHFKGSIGYMAPEYAYAARVTTKVDVYSFGVVIIRMLTGKSPERVVPEGGSLHEWVKSKLASTEGVGSDPASWEELLDIALVPQIFFNIKNTGDDNRGNQIVDKKSVRRLLRMGLACTSYHPQDRPTIHQVLANLTSQNNIIAD